MKTFWYATLATLTTLVLGTLISQSFGADRGSSPRGRSGGPSLQRAAAGGSQFRGGSLSAGVNRRVSSGPSLNGRMPGTLSPTVKPRSPGFPVSGPIRPTRPTFPVKPPVVRPPAGPFKPPVVGPIKPLPPIVRPPIGPIKPPVVGPIGPIGPVKPPIGPIKPPIGPIKPPIVGPIGPIGPIKPLPPICPPYCPPKPCPPICPPWNPGGYCGPWYPLPGWYGCYRPCRPICVSLPTYVGSPTVVTETVLVESAAPVSEVVTAAAEENLMQIPVGATLTLTEKTLGEKQGQVVLQVETLSVPGQVNEWQADQVNVTLPMFGLSAPTKAKIWLIKADGQVANVMAVELIPARPEAEGDAAAPAAAATAAVTQN